jgi:hypothetical protein
MLSIIGIKKTIKQHTADMDITDSVDYNNITISQPRLLYNPYRPNTVIYYYATLFSHFKNRYLKYHQSKGRIWYT